MMQHRFYIEDELHAELLSDHSSFAEALAELEKLAEIPWDVEPNAAPCTNWRSCGRKYEIVEYDPENPSKQICRWHALDIDAKGVIWNKDLKPG